MAPITDLGTALVTGLAAAFAAFFSALPSVLGALIVLVIGWIVAGWIAGLLARGLRAIRFDQLAQRAGVTAFLARAGVRTDPAGFIAGLVKWYVRLVFVLMAANAVGLTAVSTVVNQVLAFIPNLIVAILILGAFSWLASMARGFVHGALGGTKTTNSGLIADLTFGAVLAFGIVAAANQIGVAAVLVNTLFIGIVAALALAFGLAFGLGGREEAASVLRQMRGQANALAGTMSVDGTTPVAANRTLTTREAEERRRREEMIRSS